MRELLEAREHDGRIKNKMLAILIPRGAERDAADAR